MIRTAIIVTKLGEILLRQSTSFQSCYRFVESSKRRGKHFNDRVVQAAILPVPTEEAERLMIAHAITWDEV